MQRRGHPLGGAIAGFVFFFFVGLTLMLFGVIPLAGPWLALPIAGIVVGGIWGAWAPFGRTRPKPIGFTPIVPLGEPTGRAWSVRPVTGEVPVVPHDNVLNLQPMPVDPESGAVPPGPVAPAPVPPGVEPGVEAPLTHPSPWAPDPEPAPPSTTGEIPIVAPEDPPAEQP